MTDYSQEFLPPIQNLIAENTPWGGNLTQWKPFSSQLSGDLYQNLARNGPTQGDFGSGQNPFVVSAMGNPERAQAAEQSWRENQQMLLPASQFMQSNPLYPYNNASLTYLASNSPNIGPQYGGWSNTETPPYWNSPPTYDQFTAFPAWWNAGMDTGGITQSGQNMSQFSSPMPYQGLTSFPGADPSQNITQFMVGFGGIMGDQERSSALRNNASFEDRHQAAVQKAMAASGLSYSADTIPQSNASAPDSLPLSSIRSVEAESSWMDKVPASVRAANPDLFGGQGASDDSADKLSKLAKVMKEEFIPNVEKTTESMGILARVMGGSATGGGGDAGLYGGGMGISGGSGWLGGGFGTWGGGNGLGTWGGSPAPEEDNTPSLGGEMPSFGWGDFISAPKLKGLPLFRMRQASSMFINPMKSRMDDYMNQTAEQDLGMLQSGMMNYGDLMQGQYGDIKRRQVAGEEFSYNLGSQVYKAYGGIANATLGGDAANGILAAGAGILSPAIGMGMMGGAVGGMIGLGGPVGLLAGGATALIGAGGYAYNSSQDMMAIGRQQVNTEGQRRSGQYNVNSLFNNFSGVVGDYTEWWRNELGTTSPEESTRYQNAGRMFDVTQQYSQGGMNRSQFAAQLGDIGYSIGEGLTGAQGLFYESAAKQGMSRGQSQQFLSYWQRYNPNTMPTGQQGQDWQALTLAGVDLSSTVGSYGAAMGISPADQGGMDLANGDISRYLLGLPQGANQQLASEGIAATANTFAAGNSARRRAGLSDLNPLSFQSDLYKQNPSLVSANAAYAETSGDYALTSPSFYTNVVQPTAEEQGYGQAGAKFNVTQYYRQQTAWAQTQDIYNRSIDYGNTSPAVTNAISTYGTLDPDSQRLAMRMGTGDRMALSQNWQAMGDQRYQTLNTETGLGIFEQEKRSLQDTSLGISRGLDTYQYGMATAARNINYQTMTGGSTGVGAQGFANAGDGLSGLASLFQSQGMTLQTGNGMGMWQVQDAQTALSREQQQFGMGQTGANRDLANRQWNESFALNQRQFTMQTEYQSQNMDISRGQQTTQEGWQSQDLSMDRNRMELQYGWQQEDYTRNIRLARGRQRVDLQREQERSAITHSMDETQQTNTEERFKTETQWNKEEFDRKKDYFDQNKALAQEEMNLNKRHHDETMELQKTAFDKSKEWMTAQWTLEDQRRLLERQNAELDFKSATALAEAGRAAQLQLIAISDLLKDIGREEQNRNGFIDVNVGNGNAFVGGVGAVTPKPTTPAPIPKVGGGSGGVGFGAGAYAQSSQMVVSSGASGSGETLAPYLVQMINILQKLATDGLLKAVIYPSGNGAVTSGDVYAQAQTRFKK